MRSASFPDLHVSLEGGTIRVEGRIANDSPETWRSDQGWAAGYHLFDDPTGTLVVDGDRVPLDLAPGATSAFAMRIASPPEPGEYSIYISAMRENVAWYYEQGWPFPLIELSVAEDGVATLQGWRVADMRSVRIKRLGRSVLRAFTMPFQSIWRNRGLIRTMVRRDVLSRYTGSFGGAFWAVLNPLMLMLTYFFVFGIVMEAKFGSDTSRTGFALYFLSGFLPWLAISEAVGRAPFVLVDHRSFIKKLVFPVETLPVNLVASGLVTEFFGLILFVAALFLIRGRISPSVMYLPLVLIPQIFFTAGIAWFLAALGVFVRDLGQVIGYLITVWMFLTPIFYSETNLPKAAASVLRMNPVFVLVHAYRTILLESRPPEWGPLLWLVLVSAAVFLLGHAWFYKLRKSFADLI